MQKKLWVKLSLLLVIGSFFFVVSCAKKVPSTPPVEEMEQEIQAEEQDTGPSAEELAEQQLAELERQKLEEEELMRQKAEEAKEAFISELVHFDYNESTLRADAQEVLSAKSVWLENNPDATAVIEGHCDERGTAEYNLALGDRRAKSVKQFLVDSGIASSRITTVSYGEEMPLDPASNEDAWAKNRRAKFTVED